MAHVDGTQLPNICQNSLMAYLGHDTPDKNTNATDVNTTTMNVASLSGTILCTNIEKKITDHKYGIANIATSMNLPSIGKEKILGTKCNTNIVGTIISTK